MTTFGCLAPGGFQRPKKSPGQIAYEGYYEHSNGISLISGALLPLWENQAEVIREAWEAAAKAVRESKS